MRKQFYLIFSVLILCGSYSSHADSYNSKKVIYGRALDEKVISIKDLISFKNLTNEEIHKYLILNGWEYTGTIVKGRGGSFVPHQLKSANYKNKFNDVIISIIETDHFKDSKKQVISYTKKSISVTTESLNQYKVISNDLQNNKFKLKVERQNPSTEIALGEADAVLIKMEKEFVYVGGLIKYYTNGIDDVSFAIHNSEKFDSNKKVIKLTRYELSIDNNDNNTNSLKAIEQTNNNVIYNQELQKQNKRLKRENDSLNAFFTGAVILSAKGAKSIEKALESIKEKDIKISKLQDAITRKDSITLELLKTLRKKK